jgi:hypothetical protein
LLRSIADVLKIDIAIPDARQVVTRLRAITPAIVPKITNYRNPNQREMFLSGSAWRRGKLLEQPRNDLYGGNP